MGSKRDMINDELADKSIIAEIVHEDRRKKRTEKKEKKDSQEQREKNHNAKREYEYNLRKAQIDHPEDFKLAKELLKKHF